MRNRDEQISNKIIVNIETNQLLFNKIMSTIIAHKSDKYKLNPMIQQNLFKGFHSLFYANIQCRD